MKVDLRIADATQGWITHDELKWLAKKAKKHQRIVEIGSYLGRSTRALGDNTDGVVYAIDNFQGPKDISVSSVIANNVFELFFYNIGTLAQAGKVIPVVADHAEVDVPITPDMVFIDGSHLYPDVKRDIETWLPRLEKGGLLCGHDIHMDSVKLAVEETVGRYKVGRKTTIWYMTKH